MNSLQDLGGLQGFGKVYQPENEPVFRHEWEKRVMSMFPALFANGNFNIDEFRHGMERMGPISLLSGTYYEHWLASMEILLVENGVITQEELETGRPAPGSKKATPALTTEIVGPLLAGGASARRDAEGVVASFKVGDRVRSLPRHPMHHTRQPNYTRNRVGTIALVHGVFVTPDAYAHGLGERPQYVYAVEFTAQELWGKDASPVDTVRVDLWDEYLEAA